MKLLVIENTPGSAAPRPRAGRVGLARAAAELSALLGESGRNAAPADAPLLRVSDLEVDLAGRRAVRHGCLLDLQPREFQLLAFMMRHAGEVMSRATLFTAVWATQANLRSNIVDSHISRLRSKLDRGGPELIHTVRRAGYVLRAPD